MTWIQSSFSWAGDLYSRWFADWLHINFIIRTVLLLLILWLIVYVATLIFKYAVGPLAVLAYINIFKRFWNFFVTETIQEWIYIHYYSKGSMRFAGLYLRLTDKIKHNRTMLSNNEDRVLLRQKRIRKLGNHMMISAAIIAALWVAAFGINQEYTAPAWAAVNGSTNDSSAQDNDYPEIPYETEPDDAAERDDEPYAYNIYPPGQLSPGQFPADTPVILALTEEAQAGARLRSGPGTADTTVIEMLWGDSLLTYLGYYVADADVETLYWMRVLSPSGVEGYIGSHLVTVVG